MSVKENILGADGPWAAAVIAKSTPLLVLLVAAWAAACGLASGAKPQAAPRTGERGAESRRLAGDEAPRTGPETEKRFPPLRVPAGFKATLFACDPLVEYPSAVALGPRPGSIFVAADYMTGLGTEIVRRDEVRLLEDTDRDGYADRAVVYADRFNSVQGLTYHDGTVYALHAPLLTALRDTDGDGKADERRDLLTGLGLPPEQNPVRLHCANGLVMGHDGWLYLALGDHGCDVRRPEGDRLVLEGGGILRCRPDGRDLHVFAAGLRNIYDVALDDELNVFVRDNENDGGDYKIRVCHSFFGADHGYPYLYYERPDEALPPLADLGLGSSAGGVCYRERQFPAAYRGRLFFCEWGRAVVDCRPERAGSGFTPLTEQEFAAGAEKDPYGFKPTDLVVERDGSLIVADWADGQRPKRGRGRVYRISYVGEADKAGAGKPGPADGLENRPTLQESIARLDSESAYERIDAQTAVERRGREGLDALGEALGRKRLGVRGRLHAVWALARADGPASLDRLFDLAGTDPDPRVQAQAVRALADLADPVLVRRRLDAGPGDTGLAARLAKLAPGKGPRVLLEIVIAVGRLRWPDAPAWLQETLTKPDPALAHAALQTLRRSENWPAVLKLIDRPGTEPVRGIALRAAADRAVPELVDGLIDRLRAEPDAVRRTEYADTLSRVHKKPGPWVYWGYRPPPRPPNTVAWERTEAIDLALQRVLADPDRAARLAVLRRMQREKLVPRPGPLGQWLREETEPARTAAILESLRGYPAGDARGLLEMVMENSRQATANRLAALALFADGLEETSEGRLLALAAALEDGPVLAAAVRQLGRRPRLNAASFLLGKARSPDASVRAASVEALATLRTAGAGAEAEKLLNDKDAGVRRAAAFAAGELGVRTAAGKLLDLARDAEPAVRQASLESLRLLREPRALPLAVAALADRETHRTALHCVADLGGPDQAGAVIDAARRDPSAEVLPLVVRTLTRWGGQEESRRPDLDRAVAELQGATGILARWNPVGPLPTNTAPAAVERLAPVPKGPGPREETTSVFGSGAETRVRLGPDKGAEENAVWLAYTDLFTAEQTSVQFLSSGSGPMSVWLNGRLVYQRRGAGPLPPDTERFEAVLDRGPNRLLVQVAAAKGAAEFQARFRRKSSSAEREKLVEAALARAGNAERGRQVFFAADKSQCLKCHRLGEHGERIGPDLTGIGGRFSRMHLVEAVLEPSRAVAPGFQTVTVTLKDGRTLTGIKAEETDDLLTLGDNQGRKHQFARRDIDEQQTQPQSTMPEGLEKQLTEQEFIDLIAFLVGQKPGQQVKAPAPE